MTLVLTMPQPPETPRKRTAGGRPPGQMTTDIRALLPNGPWLALADTHNRNVLAVTLCRESKRMGAVFKRHVVDGHTYIERIA